MADTARYLQRVSFLLRQGDPIADVALYAPTDDAWSLIRPGSGRNLNLHAGIRDLVGQATVPAILDAGHTFDPDRRRDARGSAAAAIPGDRRAARDAHAGSTRRWLAAYAAGGGQGARSGHRRRSAETPGGRHSRGCRARSGGSAIGFVHRRLRDAHVYFLANTSNVARTVRATFGDRTPNVEVWDPMTGAIERVDAPGDGMTLAFEAHGSRIVVFRQSAGISPLSALRRAAGATELRTGWTLTLGGTARPGAIDLPHSWADDPSTRFFSGTASYARAVDVPAAFRAGGARVYLDFGDAPLGGARGAARRHHARQLVRRADRPADPRSGHRLRQRAARRRRLGAAVPVDVTALLRDGANDVRIDVYNTAINQLAEAEACRTSPPSPRATASASACRT
jgi:hypothetical protein